MESFPLLSATMPNGSRPYSFIPLNFNMNRRTTFKSLALWTTFSLLRPIETFSRDPEALKGKRHRHLFTAPVNPDLPEGKRLPFGWKGFSVDKSHPIQLKLTKSVPIKENELVILRCAIAIDVREEKIIKARIAGTQEELGHFDIRYAAVFHVFDLEIDPRLLSAINRHGIELTLEKGENPIWFFAATPGYTKRNNTFLPQLLTYAKDQIDREEAFIRQMCSLNSIQPFGWMEGCVLDGLHQMNKRKKHRKALKAMKLHLAHFFDREDNFIHEDPHSRPLDNKIGTIESTQPFSTLARLEPEHPVFTEVLKFWEERTQQDGTVTDHWSVTAEGSYTIAYPMAVIGKQRGDKTMMEKAYAQILLRKAMLVHEGDIYLRYYPKDDSRKYRNWARGITWYLLGMVRTMEVLQDQMDISEAAEEVARVSEMVIRYQLDNGLWPCFIHEATIAPDTSGSAGIAAAMATAVNHGWISDSYLPHCRKTYASLLDHLTPDGLLQGVAQSNKVGEALQRSNYRVTSQMGMGLMAQLYAAL